MNIVLLLLICIVIGLIPAYIAFRSDRKKGVRFFWIPSLCRFFAFGIVAALLLMPALSSTSTYEEKPVMVLLQDESSSMKHSLSKDTVGYEARVNDFVAALSTKYNVYQYGFGQHLQLDSLFTFKQSYTDLQRALSGAITLHKGHYLTDVVLISDGMQNLGGNPVYLQNDKPLQIHTVGVGDSTVPIDAAVTTVLYNKTVSVGSEFEVIVDLNFEKLKGNTAQVQIKEGAKTLFQQQIPVTASKEVKTLALKLQAGSAGLHKYQVVIAPIEGEVNRTNNTKDFFVEVTDEKIKILLCAAGAHPDLGAIKRSLQQYAPFEVQLYDGTGAFPDVASYHMAVVLQTPAYMLQNAVWKQIPKWFVLGTQANAGIFNQLQDAFELQQANGQVELFPVMNTTFNAFIVEDRLLNLSAQFPPLQSVYAPLKPKKAVDILFYKQLGQVKTTEPLWAYHLDGKQSVAVTMGEGLWKWRMATQRTTASFEIFDDLLKNTIQALAFQPNDKPLKLFLDKQLFAANEAIVVNATVKNKLGQADNASKVSIAVIKDNQEVEQIDMERLGSNYQLQVGPLEAGEYQLKAQTNLDGVDYSSTASFYVDAIDIEATRTYADYGLLMQIAQHNNGKFEVWTNLQALQDSLLQQPTSKTILKTKDTYHKLIDLKFIFFIVVVFLALEWILRKYIIV